MEELNNDCLYLMFEFLPLKDQISTAQACRLFHDVISSLWQRKYIELTTSSIWKYTSKELTILLSSICGTVQKMEIWDLEKRHLEVIKLYRYPKLSYLSGYSSVLCDKDILKLTAICPNLRSFNFDGCKLRGKYIEKWRFLEELFAPDSIKTAHLERILKKLQLKSLKLGNFEKEIEWTSELAFEKFCNLEKLIVHSRQLKDLPYLTSFNDLKVLKLYDLHSKHLLLTWIKDIARHKHQKLLELEVSHGFPMGALFVYNFMNLKKLCVRGQIASDFIYTLKCIPNLRHLVIALCCKFRIKDIFSILYYCSDIEFISVEGCQCEFSEVTLNVNDIVQNRTTLLHFNFTENFNTSYEPVSLQVQGESSLLKVTSDKLSRTTHSGCTFYFL